MGGFPVRTHGCGAIDAARIGFYESPPLGTLAGGDPAGRACRHRHLSPALRALAASTWREMLSISPRLLALIFLLKTGQALFSGLVWRNALLCAWPHRPLSYGFVLGVEQGQIAVNTVMPARAGTWAMLGIFAYAIGNVRPVKLVAVWGVQSLAYGMFAAVSYAIIAIGIPSQAGGDDGPLARVRRFAVDRPGLAGAVVIVLAVAAAIGLVLARRRIPSARQQAIEGLAIVRPPARYLRLLFLPSCVSYAFGVASYVVLLHAFDIPVTVFTVALALGSNALGGAVRMTPGGLGTSQALDVIALTAYAPAGCGNRILTLGNRHHRGRQHRGLHRRARGLDRIARYPPPDRRTAARRARRRAACAECPPTRPAPANEATG